MKAIRLGKSVKFFVIIFSLMILFVYFAWGSVVSTKEKVKNSYWLVFNVENAIADVRVNGVSVQKHSDAYDLSESRPIGHLLTNGKNVITVNFRPAFYSVSKNKTYLEDEAKKEFYISVRLDAIDAEGTKSIDVAYIEYDDKIESYVTLDKSLKHSVSKRVDGNIGFIEAGEVLDSTFISKGGQVVNSNQISFEINVDEPGLNDLRWGEAKKIDMNDRYVKDLVVNKYKEIRQHILNNDGDGYVDEFYDVWLNTVHALNISGGIEYYTQSDDVRNPLKLGEGLPLAEFDFSEENYKFETTFENRLIRLVPGPIYWGEHQISVTPVFFLDRNGEIKVASIISE
jgi:hypothetical protein